MLSIKYLDRIITKERIDRAQFSGFPIIAGAMIIILLGILLGIIGAYASAIIIGTCIMVIILLLGQDELAAAYILMIHLYVDWYLGLAIVAQMLTFVLLVILFLTR